MLNEFCKFNTDCAYEHVPNNIKEKVEASTNEIVLLKNDIEKLKENIVRTENELIKKEIVDIKEYFLQEIYKITDELSELKQQVNKETCTFKNNFKCDLCAHDCKKSITLKKHMKMKHPAKS